MIFILDPEVLAYSFLNISFHCGLCAEEVKVKTNFNKSAFTSAS